MGWLICTSLAVLALFGQCRAESVLTCTAPYEVPGCLDSCPPEKTCLNYRDPEPPCAPPTQPCKPQCVCSDGYTRERIGAFCVPNSQCELNCTAPHEVPSCSAPCPPEKTCLNLLDPNPPCQPSGGRCKVQCVCASGYTRERIGGTCVPTNQCPINCTAPHEVPGCLDSCPPEKTCLNLHDPEPPCVPPTQPCRPQCVCSDGYTRERFGRGCVPTNQCVLPVKPNCTAPHEVPGCLNPCPPEKTCQNLHDPEQPCQPSWDPCKPQCVCDSGYTRERYAGMCVPTDQCVTCPGVGEYFACYQGSYGPNCVGRCYCLDGYQRNDNNTCVPTTPSSTPYTPVQPVNTPPSYPPLSIPNNPVNVPVQPVKPVQPVQPVLPVQPVQPVQPVEPVEQGQDEEPELYTFYNL